ncbi:hypothetical protein PCANC_25480 [Puccinia coronata f. sp. avenae]|uniref:Uncharacterized protein n=1 Tax=Puccinia coronata f. sp. avenae TaxID=200324 RepID=A0A2N5SP58_9BASI|nr:hypothetical protein PCANC_25480 [Puccinia coronata f. sp. avenae]
MACQEMLKQPCSTSDLGQAPSNQSAFWPFKRVCPIMLSCRSAVGGFRVRGAKFLAAPLRLELSKLPGNPRTQLHSTYALAYFDHPPVPSRRPASQRPGQTRAGDKRRFSTPTLTWTTWGKDSTVPPWAVLGSKGEIR